MVYNIPYIDRITRTSGSHSYHFERNAVIVMKIMTSNIPLCQGQIDSRMAHMKTIHQAAKGLKDKVPIRLICLSNHNGTILI